MKQKLILLFSTILFCFLISEAALFFLIAKDLDNNQILNNLHLKPFQLPVIETKIKIDKLLDSNYNNNYQNVRLVPDSTLGWSPNPNYGQEDKLYKYNIDGIRVNEISKTFLKKDVLRIAIFGDSYIHGDEVNFEGTIGKYLEDIFHKNNVIVEVLNFAVSGFGMDQALLRYKEVNNKYNPDIILLGVQFENVKRHVNILRPFYSHITDIPYSKPRFTMNGGDLKLISNPIQNVTKTVDIIKEFGNWTFSKYEGFYNKADYSSQFLYFSNTYQAVSSLISTLNSEFEFYSPKSESYDITKNIFKEFLAHCNQNDQLFIPVHLPTINDLQFFQSTFFDLAYSQKFIYHELFDELKSMTQFVETFDKLKNWSTEDNLDKLFMKRHYSLIANRIIAEQIYDFMVTKHSQIIKN
jgi:hypothetical protein